MNLVALVGRIATAIRYQELAGRDGQPKSKASFLLAVSPPIRDAEPDWIRVECWGTTAQNVARFKGKGAQIAVDGHLRCRFFNRNGGDRGGELRPVVVADRVIFLGRASTPPAEAPAGRGKGSR